MTPEQIKQAMLSGDYDKLAAMEALEDAYSPFDAVAGGVAGLMTAPVKSFARFAGETAIDPAYEAALNFIASQDNGIGYAALPTKRGAKKLFYRGMNKPFSPDERKPVEWMTEDIDYATQYAFGVGGDAPNITPLYVGDGVGFDFGFRNYATDVHYDDIADRLVRGVTDSFEEGRITKEKGIELIDKIRDIEQPGMRKAWEWFDTNPELASILKDAGYDRVLTNEGVNGSVKAVGLLDSSLAEPAIGYAALPTKRNVRRLAMDEASRMQRAREMGLTKEGFHGTVNNIDEFDPNMVDIGVHVGSQDQANNRLADIAKERNGGYSRNTAKLESGSNVMPVVFDEGKSLTMPDVGQWNDAEVLLSVLEDIPQYRGRFDDIFEELGVKSQFEDTKDWIDSPENRELLDEIRDTLLADGYNTVKYKNVVENIYGDFAGYTDDVVRQKKEINERIKQIEATARDRNPMPDISKLDESEVNKALDDWLNKQEIKTPEEVAEIETLKAKLFDLTEEKDPHSYIVLDPARIRSKFAAFDPLKKNSGNLLAGTIPLAMLLAQEEQN